VAQRMWLFSNNHRRCRNGLRRLISYLHNKREIARAGLTITNTTRSFYLREGRPVNNVCTYCSVFASITFDSRAHLPNKTMA